MNKIRVLIVDDERLARRGLELRLADYDDFQVCGQSRNGREALAATAQLRPDLLFLDIQMPGMDGFELLRELAGPNMPIIIFVTAFDTYAIKAFEANALDYLLKPIDDARLAEAIERVRALTRANEALDHRSRLLSLLCDYAGEQLTLDEALGHNAATSARYASRLAIKEGDETICVEMEAVDWIDAAGDYMCLHSNGKTFVLRSTMKRLEEVLDPARFVRVHRSTIVNRDKICSMRPHINGEYFLKLVCDKEIKLSRNYKDNLERIAQRLSAHSQQ